METGPGRHTRDMGKYPMCALNGKSGTDCRIWGKICLCKVRIAASMNAGALLTEPKKMKECKKP